MLQVQQCAGLRAAGGGDMLPLTLSGSLACILDCDSSRSAAIMVCGNRLDSKCNECNHSCHALYIVMHLHDATGLRWGTLACERNKWSCVLVVLVRYLHVAG